MSLFMMLLVPATLLVNKIGIPLDSDVYSQSDDLCGIDLNQWYIFYSVLAGSKLLITTCRYYFFKRDRKEHLACTMVDLVAMNFLFSGLFIKANLMYFSDTNYCWYTADRFIRNFYLLFCTFSILGFLQFIYCILLSCVMPLSAFIIFKLVEFRLMSTDAQQMSDLFSEGLMGGLMQVPLPIPEILSSLNRTKYSENLRNQESQCAICWNEFNDNETVTPLHCDERHLYHTLCIESWIKKGNNSCPLCRKQIANIAGL